MDRRRLEQILSGFGKQRVLVVGDYFLDGYWDIDQTKSRLSLETPWHVNPVTGQRYYPGAAGTVVNNLCALGAGEVYCLGVIGNDSFADTLVEKLRERGADPQGLIRSPLSITPMYLKVMYHGYGEIVMEGPRFDFENQKPVSKQDQTAVLQKLRAVLPKADAVIVIEHVLDEGFGVITDHVRDELLSMAARDKDRILYADGRTRIELYSNFIIKPNRFEAKRAVHPSWKGKEISLDEARDCGIALGRKTGRPVYVTLGENGILVVDEDGSVAHVPGIKVNQRIDVVGAGDSVTAGIVLGLSAGANAFEAGTIGNMVGSITITKTGVTGTATQEEILKRFDETSN